MDNVSNSNLSLLDRSLVNSGQVPLNYDTNYTSQSSNRVVNSAVNTSNTSNSKSRDFPSTVNVDTVNVDTKFTSTNTPSDSVNVPYRSNHRVKNESVPSKFNTNQSAQYNQSNNTTIYDNDYDDMLDSGFSRPVSRINTKSTYSNYNDDGSNNNGDFRNDSFDRRRDLKRKTINTDYPTRNTQIDPSDSSIAIKTDVITDVFYFKLSDVSYSKFHYIVNNNFDYNLLNKNNLSVELLDPTQRITTKQNKIIFFNFQKRNFKNRINTVPIQNKHAIFSNGIYNLEIIDADDTSIVVQHFLTSDKNDFSPTGYYDQVLLPNSQFTNIEHASIILYLLSYSNVKISFGLYNIIQNYIDEMELFRRPFLIFFREDSHPETETSLGIDVLNI